MTGAVQGSFSQTALMTGHSASVSSISDGDMRLFSTTVNQSQAQYLQM
jgi:hypothetical protein